MEEEEGPAAEFDLNDADFLEAGIDNISVSNLGFIVFLRAKGQSRVLPIFIGANEAQSIAIAYNEQTPPRPLTHDLFKNMFDMLDCEITKVQVTALIENTFYGRIHFQREGFPEMDIDARPSDAIALAIRFKVPIYIHSEVYATASIFINEETPEVEEGQDISKGIELRPINPLEKIKIDLQRALAEERYEEAAKLRDELKRLETGN